jgi:hypothetical protein
MPVFCLLLPYFSVVHHFSHAHAHAHAQIEEKDFRAMVSILYSKEFVRGELVVSKNLASY